MNRSWIGLLGNLRPTTHRRPKTAGAGRRLLRIEPIEDRVLLSADTGYTYHVRPNWEAVGAGSIDLTIWVARITPSGESTLLNDGYLASVLDLGDSEPQLNGSANVPIINAAAEWLGEGSANLEFRTQADTANPIVAIPDSQDAAGPLSLNLQGDAAVAAGSDSGPAKPPSIADLPLVKADASDAHRSAVPRAMAAGNDGRQVEDFPLAQLQPRAQRIVFAELASGVSFIDPTPVALMANCRASDSHPVVADGGSPTVDQAFAVRSETAGEQPAALSGRLRDGLPAEPSTPRSSADNLEKPRKIDSREIEPAQARAVAFELAMATGYDAVNVGHDHLAAAMAVVQPAVASAGTATVREDPSQQRPSLFRLDDSRPRTALVSGTLAAAGIYLVRTQGREERRQYYSLHRRWQLRTRRFFDRF